MPQVSPSRNATGTGPELQLTANSSPVVILSPPRRTKNPSCSYSRSAEIFPHSQNVNPPVFPKPLRGRRPGKERLHALHHFVRRERHVHPAAQLSSIADSVREPAGKLLHLAQGIGKLGSDQVAEIAGKQLVARVLGRLVVSTGRNILLDLTKDPGIFRRRSEERRVGKE